MRCRLTRRSAPLRACHGEGALLSAPVEKCVDRRVENAQPAGVIAAVWLPRTRQGRSSRPAHPAPAGLPVHHRSVGVQVVQLRRAMRKEDGGTVRQIGAGRTRPQVAHAILLGPAKDVRRPLARLACGDHSTNTMVLPCRPEVAPRLVGPYAGAAARQVAQYHHCWKSVGSVPGSNCTASTHSVPSLQTWMATAGSPMNPPVARTTCRLQSAPTRRSRPQAGP